MDQLPTRTEAGLLTTEAFLGELAELPEYNVDAIVSLILRRQEDLKKINAAARWQHEKRRISALVKANLSDLYSGIVMQNTGLRD